MQTDRAPRQSVGLQWCVGTDDVDDDSLSVVALLEGLELLRAPPRNPEVVRDYLGAFRQFFEELPLQSRILARTLVERFNVGFRYVHVVIVRVQYDSVLEMPCPSECEGTEPLVLLNAHYLSGVVIAGSRDNDVSISAS